MIEGALRFGMDFLRKHHKLGHEVAAFGQVCKWSRNGEVFSRMQYDFDLRGEAPYLRLYYTHASDTPVDYKIRLTKTYPHYGGECWWFVCPVIGKRCGVLYSPPGQPYFASREAFGLRYDCQRENAWDRLMRRYHKRMDQFGAPEWAEGWFPRPKGRHETTYLRQVAELEYLNDLIDARFMVRGTRLLGMDVGELEGVLR